MSKDDKQYSGETFEKDGFVFAEIRPSRVEAMKTMANRMHPPTGGIVSASAVYQTFRSFFIESCVSWQRTDGVECNEENKGEFYDECFEYAFSAAYAAKTHFEGVRTERAKKLMAGSQKRGGK